MSQLSVQAPRSALLIRPHRFQVNLETRGNNSFQGENTQEGACQFSQHAYDEVIAFVDGLAGAGVQVYLFEDRGASTPDSVFPNNWFSTHSGGRVAIFPMCTRRIVSVSAATTSSRCSRPSTA